MSRNSEDLARKTHAVFTGDDKERRATTLFKAADLDGSGQIDRTEFGKLYDVIKIEVEQELAKEQALENKVRKGKRNTRMAMMVSAVLLAFLGVSVGANCAVMWVVVNNLKDTEVQGALMTDRKGEAVATGAAMDASKLTDLPAMKRPDVYDNVQKIPMNGKSSAVASWMWINEKQMVFSLSDGSDVIISDEFVLEAYSSGVVLFDSTGQAISAGNVSTALAPEAKTWCEELGCPYEKCSVESASVTGQPGFRFKRSLTCNGVKLADYKYDKDFFADLASVAGRRKLALFMLAVPLISYARVGWSTYKAYSAVTGFSVLGAVVEYQEMRKG